MVNKVQKMTFADVRSIEPGAFKTFQLPTRKALVNARATAYMCAMCSGFRVHMSSDTHNLLITITRIEKEDEQ